MARENFFIKVGKGYMIALAGRTPITLGKDLGAFFLWSFFLNHPGKEYPAAEVVMEYRHAGSYIEYSKTLTSCGGAYDDEAYDCFKNSLIEYEAEIKIAERKGDEEELKSLKSQRDAIQKVIDTCRNKFGRFRHLCDQKELFRVDFSMAVGRTIRKIEEKDIELAEHFRKHMQRGNSPIYKQPEGCAWNTENSSLE